MIMNVDFNVIALVYVALNGNVIFIIIAECCVCQLLWILYASYWNGEACYFLYKKNQIHVVGFCNTFILFGFHKFSLTYYV